MHLVKRILQVHQRKNGISHLTRQLILNYGEGKFYTPQLSVQVPVVNDTPPLAIWLRYQERSGHPIRIFIRAQRLQESLILELFNFFI